MVLDTLQGATPRRGQTRVAGDAGRDAPRCHAWYRLQSESIAATRRRHAPARYPGSRRTSSRGARDVGGLAQETPAVDHRPAGYAAGLNVSSAEPLRVDKLHEATERLRRLRRERTASLAERNGPWTRPFFISCTASASSRSTTRFGVRVIFASLTWASIRSPMSIPAFLRT